MLESLDLSRKLPRDESRAIKKQLEPRLGALQRQVVDLGIPVVIVFEGWDASGKGTLINELILPLDPRGFQVHSTVAPTEEEALRPFLWRFWTRTPPGGRIEIFDRSWYRRVLEDRVDGHLKKKARGAAFEDIRAFERQLADSGAIILKFFLHISSKEQEKRFDKLRANPTMAWRVTKEDRKRHRQYDRYRDAVEEAFAETDAGHAPWIVVEAHDRRFARAKIFKAFVSALEKGIRRTKAVRARKPPARAKAPDATMVPSILGSVDLSLSLEREPYRKELKRLQDKVRDLEHQIYMHRIPVVILYEGWDAAGKGGNLKRLTANLDPRGYEVVPIAAPNDIEKSHHYLWRFWTELPKAGHITIFDRSWYGRVLVERVEGFCTETEWRRAYREINQMEQHWTRFGAIVLKFWVHIDQDEQLRRFKEREKTRYKRWKITEEDWRNREKWDEYEAAVEEMLFRTGTPNAPWTVIESNCKLHARIKVLKTVCEALEARV